MSATACGLWVAEVRHMTCFLRIGRARGNHPMFPNGQTLRGASHVPEISITVRCGSAARVAPRDLRSVYACCRGVPVSLLGGYRPAVRYAPGGP